MEPIILLLCLLVVGFFVFRFIRRVRAERMRDDIGMPSALQHALYVSSESSGRSLKNWRTRFGAANNCLKIIVTGDALYTGVPNPLLRSVTRKYDLEHQIAKMRVTAIDGNSITVNRTITVAHGDPVWYYASDKWIGSGPDVGALEYNPPGPPGTPIMIEPENGCLNYCPWWSKPDSAFVKFFWHGDANTSDYVLELALDSSFSTVIARDTVPTPGGGYNHVFHYVALDTKYYWRVCARNDAGSSDFTETWTFNTGSMPPPTPQQLLFPGDGSEGVSADNAVFEWKPAEGFGTISYVFELSNNPAFTDLVRRDTISGTTFSCKLDYDRWYYWNISACNQGGCSSVPFLRQRFHTGSQAYFQARRLGWVH
jgi:hypothetical protein